MTIAQHIKAVIFSLKSLALTKKLLTKMAFVSNLFFLMGMLRFGGFMKPVCYLYIAFLWFFGSDKILSSEVVYFSDEIFYAV